MPTFISKYCRVKVEPCSHNSLAAVAVVCLSVEIINKNKHHEDKSNNLHFLQVCNSVSPGGEATRNINSSLIVLYWDQYRRRMEKRTPVSRFQVNI